MGDSPGTKTVEETTGEGIAFAGGFKAVTRANSYGADAADLLGNQFIVLGVKGDGTGKNQKDVFKSYTVQWTANTAGKTESNTADWEYVGKSNYFGLTGAQAIKYWDYSTTAYDFCAYSVGNGNTLITTGDPGNNQILASAITYAYTDDTDPSNPVEQTASFTLKGSRDDLAECYITDMKTVAKANYNKEVELEFRSLATKVRMAIYETVPGYSVKDVKFYSTDQGASISSFATATSATLIGKAFYSGGKYTVTYPNIGSDKSPTGANNTTDYNKAHVSITPTGTTATTQTFGELDYAAGEDALASEGSIYLKRASNNPSFAGTGTYYQTVLPKEDGTVLEMCVDYTLVSNDGSGEEITVHGAKAFVPAVYTKWLPNYAYTYIFKISDNTNGYTNPNDSDPAGLYPITFDAIVLDSEETGHQTTITTVATPSITTYQKGHVYSASNEYDNTKMIYVQVHNDGTLITDLNSKDGEDKFDKSFFYKLSADKTEADVMDALNIRTSGDATTIVGRNGLSLTPATINREITAIPGEDGNDIEVNEGEAAELDPAEGGTYAFVYLVSTGSPTWIYTAEQLTEDDAPSNFTTDYYKQTAANDFTQCVAGDYDKNKYYYKRYQDLNNVYAVKVIKVQ